MIPGDIVKKRQSSDGLNGYVIGSELDCYLQVKGSRQIISKVNVHAMHTVIC